jgi:hypothetical protein
MPFQKMWVRSLEHTTGLEHAAILIDECPNAIGVIDLPAAPTGWGARRADSRNGVTYFSLGTSE